MFNNYPKDQRYTLSILQDLQKEYGYIPKDKLVELSQYMEVPLSKLYSMATFYKALSLKPKGKYIIKVCDGTACHIRSSKSLLDEIENTLGIKPGETTEDGKFSLETVNCLGSCAIAPVMVINDKYYGKLTSSMVRTILNEYRGTDDD